MTKTIVLASILTFGSPALAFKTTPGLWEVSMEISANGVKVDPMAALRSVMDSIPESQRKEMEKNMKGSLPSSSNKVCLDKNTLMDPSDITPSEDCDYKITKKTDSLVEGTAVCKEIKGTFKFQKKSNTEMFYHLKGKDSNNQAYEITSRSKFISKDCGKIKPL